MIRLTTMMMIGSVLLLAGCGQGELDLRGRVDAASADTDSNVNTPATKSQIVRALLQAIDEIKGESPEVKDELRTTLIEADKQLRQVLGGQSKRLIEAANRKPLVPIIGQRPKVARDEKTSATRPKPGTASFKPPATDPSGEPKTKIVKALIEAIEQIEDEDADTKQGLRQSLMQADLELSRILGDNSKRLIQQANKKPLVPMIREAACPPEKEPTEKERTEKE